MEERRFSSFKAGLLKEPYTRGKNSARGTQKRLGTVDLPGFWLPIKQLTGNDFSGQCGEHSLVPAAQGNGGSPRDLLNLTGLLRPMSSDSPRRTCRRIGYASGNGPKIVYSQVTDQLAVPACFAFYLPFA